VGALPLTGQTSSLQQTMAGQVKPERKNVKLHVATVVKKDTGRTCALNLVTIAMTWRRLPNDDVKKIPLQAKS
jgi:hypothetical protein